MKRKKCMADGGVVGKDSAEEMLRRMREKYGLDYQSPPPAPRQPTPKQPVVAESPPSTGLVGAAAYAIRRRAEELKKVSGYKDGGMPSQVQQFLVGVPSFAAPSMQRLGPSLAQTAAPVGQTPQSQGLLTGIQDYSTTPAQLANSGNPAFTWEDGTPRGAAPGATPPAQPAGNRALQGIDQQISMNNAMSGLTMSEKQALQNPTNAPYRIVADRPAAGFSVSPGGGSAEASMLNRKTDALKSLRENMAGSSGFANGGIVQFSGKGGPRDDQIPVAVAGNEINVSDGEAAVILPAKTAANRAALGIIGGVIEATNDGRAPKMGMADGGRYARGANALTPAELAAQIYQEQTGQQAPTGANPAPATRGVTGDFQNGATASFQATQPVQVSAQATERTDPGKYPYTGQSAQNPYQDASLAGAVEAVTPANRLASHPIYSGVSLGGLVDAVTPSGGEQQAAPAQQAKIVEQQAPGGGMAAVATQPKPQAPQQAAPAKGVLDWLPEGGVLRPENRQEFGQKFAEISERGMAGRGILTGKPTAQSAAAQKQAPQQSQASYSNKGRQSAVQAASMDAQTADPNIAATTGNSGARVMPSGAVEVNMGRGFDPTKLQMAPGYGMASNASGKTLSVGPSQYVAADGSTTSRWEDTQQYKDAIARNEADKIRLAEMQAARRGSDPMAIQAARQGIASAVLGNQARQAEMQRNEYIQSLVAKAAAETDPLKQRAIIDTALAAQGKDSKHGKNLQVVDLGEYSVPDGIGGLKVVKRGQALYDADTKQVIPITPGQGGGAGGSAPQPSFASQAEAEAAQKSGRIKVGDVVIIGGKRFAVE